MSGKKRPLSFKGNLKHLGPSLCPVMHTRRCLKEKTRPTQRKAGMRDGDKSVRQPVTSSPLVLFCYDSQNIFFSLLSQVPFSCNPKNDLENIAVNVNLICPLPLFTHHPSLYHGCPVESGLQSPESLLPPRHSEGFMIHCEGY